MKITKELAGKYRDEVLSAYQYFWDENALPTDRNLIRGFFDKCGEMEYSEFIQKVNDKYGALLENYRQATQIKMMAAIRGILIFVLIMYMIGIVIKILGAIAFYS